MRVWFILMACAVIAGCAPSQRSPRRPYQTIPASPGRDADKADRINVQALDFIEKGDLDKAEAALKRALPVDVSHGAAHNNLGTVHLQRGKYYLAAWEFQYATKLMPTQPQPRNNLGLLYERVGRLDDAVTWYGKAIDLEPDSPVFLGNAARARIRRGDDGPEVRDLLTKLVEGDLRPEWVAWARQQLLFARPTRARRGDAGDVAP